jgi:hypothetical protein
VNGKPPGFLRLLWRMAGDWLYGLLISFGWQPREEQGKPQEPPVS